MRRVSAALFAVVVFSFSAVLLVLSLLAAIRLAALNDSASRLEARTEKLRDENAALLARYEQCVSLDEVERRATEELGMRRCTAEQIEYIDISEYTETSEQTG